MERRKWGSVVQQCAYIVLYACMRARASGKTLSRYWEFKISFADSVRAPGKRFTALKLHYMQYIVLSRVI